MRAAEVFDDGPGVVEGQQRVSARGGEGLYEEVRLRVAADEPGAQTHVLEQIFTQVGETIG